MPSVRAAVLAGVWLAAVCVVILGAVALPLPARVGICVAIATPALAAIRSSLLLRGYASVAMLEWSSQGWRASFGSGHSEMPVTLRKGSFRLGTVMVVLWLEACDGIHVVCIDAGRQDSVSIRRLCRRLGWSPRQPDRARTGKLLPSNPKV